MMSTIVGQRTSQRAPRVPAGDVVSALRLGKDGVVEGGSDTGLLGLYICDWANKCILSTTVLVKSRQLRLCRGWLNATQTFPTRSIISVPMRGAVAAFRMVTPSGPRAKVPVYPLKLSG
jgi:hypothetical protein